MANVWQKPGHQQIAWRWALLLLAGLVAFAPTAIAQPVVRDRLEELGRGTSASSPLDHAGLQAIEKQIVAVTRKVAPAVVCIEAPGGGSGSGVIVSRDGLVLTAAHVVDKGADFTVRYPDGRRFKAKRLGMFAGRDAAMVQITEGAPHPFAEVGTSGDLEFNDWVIALGHPGGFDEERKAPLRVGHVVGNGHWLTTDCALIGGDSGGPSFDLQGRVIGIHSNISGSISSNNDVPADVYHEQWEFMLAGKSSGTVAQALATGRQQRSLLGLVFDEDPDEPIETGARVALVLPLSPASEAEFEVGDIVTHLNDEAVQSPAALLRALQETAPGKRVKLEATRDGGSFTKRVRLISEAELQQRRAQGSVKPPERRETDEGEIVRRRTQLQELLEKAKQNGGRLKIDREALAKLQAEMAVRMEGLAPVGGRPRDEWSRQFSRVFQLVTEPVSAHTLRVTLKQRPVALATVVGPAGLAVTKLSEISAREFELRDDAGNVYPGNVVASADDLDLALIEIQGYDGPALSLNDLQDTAPQGTLCAAAGLRDEPLGIGVISVVERSLSSATKAILGVEPQLVNSEVKIKSLATGGAAEAAGLKAGDVIVAIEGQPLRKVEALQAAITSRLPGDELRMEVRRGDVESSFAVTLGDASVVAPMAGAREQGTDGMSTRRSKRRWAFRRGIQHDCAIQPKHCGGPLMSLDGKLLGINIARAGRIRSYAIPARLVALFVRESIDNQASQTTDDVVSERTSDQVDSDARLDQE